MKRARTHDPGLMNFAISVEGFIEIVTVHLVYLPLLWKWRKGFFFKELINFRYMAILAQPWALTPNSEAMNFTLLVEGFTDIIIIHLTYIFPKLS